MRQCVDLLELIDTDLRTNLRRIELSMAEHGHGMAVVSCDIGLLGFVPLPNLLALSEMKKQNLTINLSLPELFSLYCPTIPALIRFLT